MDNGSVTDKEFRTHFIDWFVNSPHSKTLEEVVQYDAKYTTLKQLVLNDGISLPFFIQIVVECLRLYPDQRHRILHGIVADFARDMSERGGKSQLVFLWLFTSCQALQEIDTPEKVFDITRTLVSIAGDDVARSYLNYLMFTQGDQITNVVPAYYFTGYDTQTWRLVIQAVASQKQSLQLKQILYLYVMNFVYANKFGDLHTEDQQFLRNFLQEYCVSALDELNSKPSSGEI